MQTAIIFSSASEQFGVDVQYTYAVNESTDFVLRGVANREQARKEQSTAGEYLKGELVHSCSCAGDWPVDLKLVAWAAQGKQLDKWGAKAVATKTLEVDESTQARARLTVSNRKISNGRNVLLAGTLSRTFTLADDEDEWLGGLRCSSDGRCSLGVRNGSLSVQKELSVGGKSGEPGAWRARYVLSGDDAPKLFF